MDELFVRGLTNIKDAHFVRSAFIPTALDAERWNLVVYETSRATELLIRGMSRLLGHEPPQHHDIQAHVAFLVNRLPNPEVAPIPFVLGAYREDGAYCVCTVAGEEIEFALGRKDRPAHAVSKLGRQILPDRGVVDLKLEFSTKGKQEEGVYPSSGVGLYVNGQELAWMSGVGVPDQYTIIEKRFFREPDPVKVRELKKIGERLYKNRNRAFYVDSHYLKQDAANAVSDMDEAFEMSKMFFLVE